MHPLLLRMARKVGPIFAPLVSKLPFNQEVEGLDAKEWVGFLLFVGLLSFYYILFVLFLFLSPLLSLLFAVVGSILLTDLLSFLPFYQKNRKIERLEDSCPSTIDLFVAQYRTKNIYSAFLEAGKSGPLGKYFLETYAGLRSGLETRFLFKKFKISKYLEKVGQLLFLMTEKGIDTTDQLLEIAEDMIEERHIHKKKKLMVSRDAILLFMVFAFIVPFIFAMSADIIQIFADIHPTTQSEQILLLRNLLLGSIPLNAYFLSMIMGELLKDDSRQGFLYFPLLSSVGIAVFLGSHELLGWFYGF